MEQTQTGDDLESEVEQHILKACDVLRPVLYEYHVLSLLAEHSQIGRSRLYYPGGAAKTLPDFLGRLIEQGVLVRQRGRRGGVRVTNHITVAAALENYRSIKDALLQQPLFSDAVARCLAEFDGPPDEPDGELNQDGDAVEPKYAASDARFPLDSWQYEVIQYLTKHFTRAELVEFLPPAFQKALRSWRRLNGLADSLGTRIEIAEALLVRHDRDLLRDCKALRDAIATKLGVEAPDRLRGGKQTAFTFVDRIGLPRELAGAASPPRLPASVRLEALAPLRELEPYQAELKAKLLTTLMTAGRGLVTLPTGAGKTRVAVEAIHEWLKVITTSQSRRVETAPVVVWVAHTAELCEQACSSFEDIWRSRATGVSVVLARYWGPYTREHRTSNHTAFRVGEREPTLVVTTPQSLLALLRDPADEMLARESLRDRCRALVIDEAHRAATPMYRQLINTFGRQGIAAALGLTATPFRVTYSESSGETETGELIDLFGNLHESEELGRDPRDELISRRVLAKPVFDEIKPERQLRVAAKLRGAIPDEGDQELGPDRDEQIDSVLAAAADDRHRRRSVFRRVRQIAIHPAARVLYFGPRIADAELMAFLLLQEGIPSAAVSSTTRESTRRRLIEEFRRGQIRVLCNCEVLTTGFDAPRVTDVVVARPTVSLVLFEQMIGRGLRGPLFGGTETCRIVTVDDRLDTDRIRLAHEVFRQQWRGATSYPRR